MTTALIVVCIVFCIAVAVAVVGHLGYGINRDKAWRMHVHRDRAARRRRHRRLPT